MPVWGNGWLIFASWLRYLRVLLPLQDSRHAICCKSAIQERSYACRTVRLRGLQQQPERRIKRSACRARAG